MLGFGALGLFRRSPAQLDTTRPSRGHDFAFTKKVQPLAPIFMISKPSIRSFTASVPDVSKSISRTIAGSRRRSARREQNGRAWKRQRSPPRRNGEATERPRSSIRVLLDVSEQGRPARVTPQQVRAMAHYLAIERNSSQRRTRARHGAYASYTAGW